MTDGRSLLVSTAMHSNVQSLAKTKFCADFSCSLATLRNAIQYFSDKLVKNFDVSNTVPVGH